MTRRSEVLSRDVLYAQCWEDPRSDREAFRISQEDTVFSITSGGCNTLAFLLDDPKRVYALDLNPCQNHLLDLKMAAFAALTYGEMLEFLGVRESSRRHALYAHVRPALGIAARRYWDGRPERIAAGIIHAGRYEGYMKLLRSVLERIQGKGLIRDLFAEGDPAARRALYRQRWDTPLWRAFTRVFLSRSLMSALFTGEFFSYVEGSFSFGDHFARLVERALTEMPLRENYFAAYILLGRYYGEENLPPYLRSENFAPIRSRLSRIRMITGSCADFFAAEPESSIHKFNFTNIFEWMSAGEFERLLRQTWRVGADGAVLTYRNLLVFRERPALLAPMIEPDRTLAASLHRDDRSFIYRNYVVERIIKHRQRWNTLSNMSHAVVH